MVTALESLAKEFEEVEEQGVTIAEGVKKTAKGVIRIPKSRLKRMQDSEALQPSAKMPTSVQPDEEHQASKMPVKSTRKVEAVFETPMGNIKGTYYTVVESGRYIILELSENSFVPIEYEKAPELVMRMRTNSINARVIYTGCRWVDPDTGREFIILMKGEDNAE